MPNYFELSNEEKARLQKFSKDPLVFLLKKLFLNVCMNNPASNEAIAKIQEAFHALSVLQASSPETRKEENLV